MRITFPITIKCRNGSTFIQLSTSQQTVQIFNIRVPDKPLTNIELVRYARLLKIPDFRGVVMRDTLSLHPFSVECGIVNFYTSNQPGNHWVCYYCNKTDIIYFDSYGQITPVAIQRYLKIGCEFDRGKEVIQRNTDIVQAARTPVCGHLCLFVLKSLTVAVNSNQLYITCNTMDIYQVIGKILFKPKKVFVLPWHRFTEPYNP